MVNDEENEMWEKRVERKKCFYEGTCLFLD